MSLTPMKRHMKRVREEQAAQAQKQKLDSGADEASADNIQDYSAFETTKASLESDVKALDKLPRDERDEFRKNTLIPRYQNHVDAYIESESVFANPVLVYMIIWLVDLCRLGPAISLAKVAIEQSQEMPKQFNRNIATFLADEVLAWADKEYKLNHSIAPYFDDVFGLLDTWSVNDIVKMKFNKMAGSMALDSEEYLNAIAYFEKAVALETPQHKASVTTKLNAARKKVAEFNQANEKQDNQQTV